MESVAMALVTGMLALAGALVSNSHSRAVMEVKVDTLCGRLGSTTASSSSPTPWSRTSPS